jgi:L-2,4-diaminobutyrate decarboxylase
VTIDTRRAETNDLSTLVLLQDGATLEGLRRLVNDALDILEENGRARVGPVEPGGPAASRSFAESALAGPLLPEEGAPREALRHLRSYAEWAVDIGHPATVARMQCPPAAVAIAADLIVTTLNQSLHAWEAGPFALEVERRLVAELASLVGYGPDAGGTITAGGSISNITAMLIARDDAYTKRFGESSFHTGVARRDVRPVVLCTETVHFSVDRGVSIAGIGTDSIIRVPTDEYGRMLPAEADRILRELAPDQLPVILLTCAGSTDFGWVDPLPELAEVARRHNVWLHADAAYGGGALFSDRLRPLLDGIAEADSVTLDLHKFGWTPASSGIFLVRRAESLDHLAAQQTSLNSPDDVAEGFIGRYGSSIQATRRCDALKIAATLTAHGRTGMGRLVDDCHELARYGAARVATEPRLELAAQPVLSTVLFRYLPEPGVDVDAFNSALRRRLMREGRALLARVHLPKGGVRRVFLKLMLLNPMTRAAEIDAVLDVVLATAREMEKSS